MRPAVKSVTLVGSPEKYGPLGLPVIPDAVADFGPLAGLLAALEDSDEEWNLIAACDMPFVTTELFRFLAERAVDCTGDVLLPYDHEDRPEPLCAAYRSSAAPTVRRAMKSGIHKVMRGLEGLKIIALTPSDFALVDPEGVVFTNMNRPGDFEQLALGVKG